MIKTKSKMKCVEKMQNEKQLQFNITTKIRNW